MLYVLGSLTTFCTCPCRSAQEGPTPAPSQPRPEPGQPAAAAQAPPPTPAPQQQPAAQPGTWQPAQHQPGPSPEGPKSAPAVPGPVESLHLGSAAPGGSEAGARPGRRVAREDENHIVVKGVVYTKLELVGKGGSCKVFKVRRRAAGRDKVDYAGTGVDWELQLVTTFDQGGMLCEQGCGSCGGRACMGAPKSGEAVIAHHAHMAARSMSFPACAQL